MKLKLLFALLFVTISNAQTQIGQDINGDILNGRSGTSISLSADGNTVAIGTITSNSNTSYFGFVKVYENISGVWAQIGTNIYGKSSDDNNGESVSISDNGKRVIMGAPRAKLNGTEVGHAQVYENISGVWTQVGQDIYGTTLYESLGKNVYISGDGLTIAVSTKATINGTFGAGSVIIYEYLAGTWVQKGQIITGNLQYENFGHSLSLSKNGNIIAVGAPGSSGNGYQSGRVRIFEYKNNSWSQIGYYIDGVVSDAKNGSSISLSDDGNIIAIATRNYKNVDMLGSVRVFKNTNNVWTKMGQEIFINSAIINNSYLTVSLSENGMILAIGAPVNINDYSNTKGTVHIYQYYLNNWTQVGSDIEGMSVGDQNGFSLSISNNGSKVAIGAPQYGDGYARIYDLTNILSSDTFVLENFNIYPNPTTDILNIELKENLTLEKVLIYNTTGQLVKETAENKINVSGFAKGIYNVQVLTNQGKATKKVIVK